MANRLITDYDLPYMVGDHGPMAVDWEERINYGRMREERKGRALAALKKNDLAGVLLLTDANIRYVTGVATGNFTGMGGLHYTLLAADGQLIHWDTADHAESEKFNCPWLPDVRISVPGIGFVPGTAMNELGARFLMDRMIGELMAGIKKLGLEGKRIGIDGRHHGLEAALAEKGVRIVPAGHLLLRARSIKTADEVECLRMICSIVEAGFDTVKRNLRPGVRENDLLAEGIRTMIKLGAQHGEGKVASGPNTWPKSQAMYSDRIVRPGDVVYVDFYDFHFSGYRSCYYRTFCVGEPRKETVEAFDRAVKYCYDVMNAMKPGSLTSEAARFFPDDKQEYWDFYGAEHASQMTTNHWGHGIGLALYEEPLVWRGVSLDYPATFEEGMTLAVETQDRDGRNGVRFEDMLVIRKDGPEVLSRWPATITVCG